MGSPISPVVANIFMNKIEETAISTFSLKPKVWYRFVDDVFLIVQRKHVYRLIVHLNQQETSITFTVEIENERRLPYLDVKVIRSLGGKLETSIYRKPTQTGRHLDFHSSHPTSVKRPVVSSLMRRIDYVTIPGKEETRRRATHLQGTSSQQLSNVIYPKSQAEHEQGARKATFSKSGKKEREHYCQYSIRKRC